MGESGQRADRKIIMAMIPLRLQTIIDEFHLCEGQEKIELLVQYAQSLPALPHWLAEERAKMEPVPECMTPVFLHLESRAGGVVLHFDVPAESPTVRGFASILKQGLDQATPEEILQIPGDFYQALGLHQLLTHQRLQGFSAILAHIKQACLRILAEEP